MRPGTDRRPVLRPAPFPRTGGGRRSRRGYHALPQERDGAHRQSGVRGRARAPQARHQRGQGQRADQFPAVARDDD